jgi:hypothetical protein
MYYGQNYDYFFTDSIAPSVLTNSIAISVLTDSNSINVANYRCYEY